MPSRNVALATPCPTATRGPHPASALAPGATSDAWWLYVLLCANERLYVGIARDVDARLALHCSGKGAFYTRLNVPLRVMARQRHESRSAALRAEYALKQLSKRQKLAWVAALAGDNCFATSGRGPAPTTNR
jgi:putative endonuclease